VRRVLLALLRVAIGVVFIGAGVRKLSDRATSNANFDHWGVPAPTTMVVVISVLEIICGLLVLLGLATRLGALVLCIDGGFHLVVPPVLALLCLVLVARGGGRWQLLDRVDPPR
jgi:uncharacterized membrane protein YphA (DoxX/SURF4 family)